MTKQFTWRQTAAKWLRDSRPSRGRNRRAKLEQAEPRWVLSATTLVADLEQTPAFVYSTLTVESHVEWDGKLYFTGRAERGPDAVDIDLWQFDPAANGGEGATTRAATIPGGAALASVQSLTVLDGKIYFYVADGTRTKTIWRFDPATSEDEASPVRVGQFATLQPGELPRLVPHDGRLYFPAYDELRGTELWQFDPAADGGAGGLALVVEIHPGSGSSDPIHLTSLGGRLYFAANDGASGRELWQFDPAAEHPAAALRQVADIAPGGMSSNPAFLAVLGERLYFAANDGTHGSELWVYDPAAVEGTGAAMLVEDIAGGSASSFPSGLTAMAGELYFSASDGVSGTELWRYDPAASGGAGAAQQVADIRSGSGSASPRDLTVIANTLYFSADDGEHGRELWRYERTLDTAELTSDLVLGSGSSNPRGFAAIGTNLLFHATDGTGPSGIWHYQTAFGGDQPIRIFDANATASAFPDEMATLDGQLYFTAHDEEYGKRMWRFDPSANGGDGGVFFVADPYDGNRSANYELTAVDGRLYFSGYNGYEYQLWQYDPAEDTATVVASGQFTSPANLTAFDGRLYFQASDPLHGAELWQYDPSADNGTGHVMRLTDIHPSGSSAPSHLAVLDGNLYFSAYTPELGHELWRYDPAANNGAGGVSLAADIRPGSAGSSPQELTVLDGRLYFRADDGVHGEELWQYDPAAAGGMGAAVLMADIRSGSEASGLQDLVPLDGLLYFVADDGVYGRELWRFDPAASNDAGAASLVVDLVAGENSSDVQQMQALDGKLYFTWNDEVAGYELWQYDPAPNQEAGVVTVVSDLVNGRGSSMPADLTALGGKLYFSAFSQRWGRELFVHDPNYDPTESRLSIKLVFAENPSEVGTVASGIDGTMATFHEWENAHGEMWITIEEALPERPFDLTWQLTATESWFGAAQLVSHLAEGSTWITAEEDGTRTATGTLQGLDLSDYQVGDRVLVATLLFPQDPENLVGVPIGEPGEYAQPTAEHGVQLTMAHTSAHHITLDVNGEVAGQFVPVIYDADDDGRVGLTDFAQFVSQFGSYTDATSPAAFRFDYDRNGVVGLSDFFYFVQHFGLTKGSPHLEIHQPQVEGGADSAPEVDLLTLEAEHVTEHVEVNPVGRYLLMDEELVPPSFANVAYQTAISQEQTADEPTGVGVLQLDPRTIDAIFQQQVRDTSNFEEDEGPFESDPLLPDGTLPFD